MAHGFDHDVAHDCLQRFVACMDRNYAGRFFVTDGTLLGLVRNGDFIPGDLDLDFGMRIGDFDDRLIGVLEASGFELSQSFGNRDRGLVLQFLTKNIS